MDRTHLSCPPLSWSCSLTECVEIATHYIEDSLAIISFLLPISLISIWSLHLNSLVIFSWFLTSGYFSSLEVNLLVYAFVVVQLLKHLGLFLIISNRILFSFHSYRNIPIIKIFISTSPSPLYPFFPLFLFLLYLFIIHNFLLHTFFLFFILLLIIFYTIHPPLLASVTLCDMLAQ